MTVIKTFKRTALKKGGVYRKSDLIEDLNGFENMASTYYDPARSNELYTFFNQESKDWKNVYYPQPNELHYRHRREPKLTRCNKWELPMERHIFLREKGMKGGDFKYLGAVKGENIKVINSFEVRIMALH